MEKVETSKAVCADIWKMWEIQLINIMHLDLQRKWWNDIKIIRHCLHLDYAMKLEMAIFPIQNMLENAMLIG